METLLSLDKERTAYKSGPAKSFLDETIANIFNRDVKSAKTLTPVIYRIAPEHYRLGTCPIPR